MSEKNISYERRPKEIKIGQPHTANRTALKYDESLARMVLEYAFPRLFDGLRVLDKPDLQDAQKNIGIEVTNCQCKGAHNGEWAAAVYRRAKVSGQVSPVTGSVQEAGEQIVAAIRRKLAKLNSNATRYEPLTTYSLFLFLPYALPNVDIEEGEAEKLSVSVWKELENHQARSYTSLFILAQDILIAFFKPSKTVTYIPLSRDTVRGLCFAARDEVGQVDAIKEKEGRFAANQFANSPELSDWRHARLVSLKEKQGLFTSAS